MRVPARLAALLCLLASGLLRAQELPDLCHQDLQATLLDVRQCQASCANASFRLEREWQRQTQDALRQRDHEAQERYDALRREYEQYKRDHPAPAVTQKDP